MIISGSTTGLFLGYLALATMAVVSISAHSVPGPQQGCKSRGFCCQGRNNTCRSTQTDNVREPLKKMKIKEDEAESSDNNDKMSEAEDKDSKRRTCFCDAACLDLGDCCEDHRDFCPPVDCVVAAKWSEWGACDSRCGAGVKQRTRKVIRAPLNGGKACSSTVEKIPCEGANCKVARAPEGLEQLRETGKIIPANFGTWRKSKLYDPFKDIRRNLFDHYQSKHVVNRPSYCVRFELTEVPVACNSTDQWTRDLVSGRSVCVECQPTAMHKQLGGRCVGQGVLLRETRWNAALAPGCHGKWTMQSRQENCHCDPDSTASFILL